MLPQPPVSGNRVDVAVHRCSLQKPSGSLAAVPLTARGGEREEWRHTESQHEAVRQDGWNVCYTRNVTSNNNTGPQTDVARRSAKISHTRKVPRSQTFNSQPRIQHRGPRQSAHWYMC